MKKLIVLLIAITCLICACGNGDKLPPTSEMNTETNGNSSQGELSTESAEEQMQKLIDYNKAMDLLNSLTGEISVEQFEIMENAYSILEKLGDYKDVQDILSQFNEYTFKMFDNYLIVYDDKNVAKSTIRGNEYYSISSYTYNDNGQIIRKDIKQVWLRGAENNYYYTYEYDSNGNLIKEYYSGYDEGGTSPSRTYCYSNYTFDNNGNIIEKTEECDGKIIEYSYVYDNNENVIEEYKKTSTYTGVYHYTYDEQGRVITAEYSSGDPHYDQTTTYEYKQYHLYKNIFE